MEIDVGNLARSIFTRGAKTPDRVATQSGAGSLTYCQLEEQATRAAHVLRNKGVGPGDIVAVAFRDGQQVMVTMLASWLLGATCNPIDMRLPASEKKALWEKYGYALVLEDRSRPDGGYPGLSLSQWTQELAAAPVSPLPAVENQGPALLNFTSGTTGEPVGMEISHEGNLFSSAILIEAIPAQFYERYLSVAPLSFGGSAPWVIDTLMTGGTVIFFPTIFQPRDLIEAFDKHRITGCTLVPTVLRDLLGYLRESGKNMATADSRLHLVTHAAFIQPSDLASIRELVTPHVLQVYACHPVGCVTCLVLEDAPAKADTVGRPLRGVAVEIVDEDGRPQPPLTGGQIRINSPRRAKMLEGRDAATGSDRFVGDWYYPGDLGLIDKDGYLRLLGRETEMIIRGGVNVYPQEVEAALSGMTGVRQVAAVGYPDQRNGEEIALFAAVDPGISAEDLQKQCRDRLGPDKRPKRILIVPEIPLNASGKVMRRELARQHLGTQQA